MAFGNLLKSLFGGSEKTIQPKEALGEAIEYEGFTIEPAPIDEGGKYRIAGYISGEHEGETRRIQFIRADETTDKQQAIDSSTAKARQIINEQGRKLLERTQL